MRHVQLIAISGGMSQYQCEYGDVLMDSNWSCIIRIHWWTTHESWSTGIDYWYCHLVRLYLCRLKLFD
jgi:hypothetical protein